MERNFPLEGENSMEFRTGKIITSCSSNQLSHPKYAASKVLTPNIAPKNDILLAWIMLSHVLRGCFRGRWQCVRVTPLWLLTSAKRASQDWLFPDPFGIPKAGSDKKKLLKKCENTGVCNEMHSKLINTPKIYEYNIQPLWPNNRTSFSLNFSRPPLAKSLPRLSERRRRLKFRLNKLEIGQNRI